MVLQRHNTIVMLLFISSNSILRLISNRPLALREQRKYLEVEEITASLCLPLANLFLSTSTFTWYKIATTRYCSSRPLKPVWENMRLGGIMQRGVRALLWDEDYVA